MIYILGLILIFLHLFLLSSFQFTAWPEVFSYPYLVNKGFVIYKDFAHPYEPVLTLILSTWFNIFDYSAQSLKNYTYLSIAINDLVILLLAIKFLGMKWRALIPLLFYVLFQPLFEGNQLWFDLASTPFLLLSIYFYLTIKKEKYKFLFTGLFLSLAFFIKQQQAIAIVVFFLYLLIFRKINKNFFYFVIGGLIPLGFTLLYVFSTNSFKEFFFWTISVPIYYYPKTPGYAELPTQNDLIKTGLIFLIPLFFLVRSYKKMDVEMKLFLFLFAATFAVAFPRFALFRLQPALAIFALCLIPLLNTSIKKLMLIFVAPIIASVLMFQYLVPFLGTNQTRFYTSRDIDLAKEINKNTKDSDHIFLLGPHSLTYVIADRLPPKPWVDNFNWYMEIPGIQEQVINGLEKDKPVFIYRSIPYRGEWYELGTYQPKKVVEFITKNYELKEIKNKDIEVWRLKDE